MTRLWALWSSHRPKWREQKHNFSPKFERNAINKIQLRIKCAPFKPSNDYYCIWMLFGALVIPIMLFVVCAALARRFFVFPPRVGLWLRSSACTALQATEPQNNQSANDKQKQKFEIINLNIFFHSVYSIISDKNNRNQMNVYVKAIGEWQ